MRITNVEAIPVSIDLKPLEQPGGLAPYVTGVNTAWEKPRTLVKLETDEGITGWGEMKTVLTPEVVTAAVETYVAPEVVGEDIWSVVSLNETVTGYTGYLHADIFCSGVEMAMWDALGKYLDAPVHQLLGGKTTDTVDFAYCVGILDPESSRKHVRRAREMGFSTLKTKAGGYRLHDRTIQDDVDRLAAMDGVTDGEVELRVDPNQCLQLEDAVRLGARLEDAGVYLQYFEQPIRIDNVGSYKRLRERLRTPIGVNEDLYFPRNFYELVREDAVDAGVIDMVPAGGIGPMKKLAAVAEEAGVSLAHHCGFDLGVKTAAILHAVSTTPAIDLPSDTAYYGLADRVIEDPFEFEDGALSVPDAPGLGIEVSERAVEELRIA